MYTNKMKIFEITTTTTSGNIATGVSTAKEQPQEQQLPERTLRNSRSCPENSSTPIITVPNIQSQPQIETSLVHKFKYLNKSNNKRNNNHENLSSASGSLVENNQSENKYCKRQSQQAHFGNIMHRKKWNNLQQQHNQYETHSQPQQQVLHSPKKQNNNNNAVKNQNLITSSSPIPTTQNSIRFTNTSSDTLIDNKTNGRAHRKVNVTFKNISKDNTLSCPPSENQTSNYSCMFSSTESLETSRQTSEQKAPLKQEKNVSFQTLKVDNGVQKSNNTPKATRNANVGVSGATSSASTIKSHRVFGSLKKKSFWRNCQTQSPRQHRSPRTGFEHKKSIPEHSMIKILRPVLPCSLTASKENLNTLASSEVNETSKSPIGTQLSKGQIRDESSPSGQPDNNNPYINEGRGWPFAKNTSREQHNNYQQHYYPHPQQLTIASFLQKDLLVGKTNSENGRNDDQQFSSGQHQHGFLGYQQPRCQGRLNDRNGNMHGFSQQQHQHIIYPYHMSQQHQQYIRRNKHNAGKKSNHNFIPNVANTNVPPPSITSISSSSSSVCSSSASIASSNLQRPQLQPPNQMGGIESNYLNNYNSAHRGLNPNNNNYFYQHNFNGSHHGALQYSGATTPTTPHHQNFYNLTYVNMDPLDNKVSTLATYVSSPMSSSSASSYVSGNSTNRNSRPPSNIENGSCVMPLPSKNQCFTKQDNKHVRLFPSPTSINSPALQGSVPPLPSTNIISCSQLDEAITSAAAASNDFSTSLSSATAPINIDLSELQSTRQVHMVQGPSIPPITMLRVPQHSFSQHGSLPSSPHDDPPPTPQQSNQQEAQNDLLILAIEENISWNHSPTSPCFQQPPSSYSFHNSPHVNQFNGAQRSSTSGGPWNNRRVTDVQHPNLYGSYPQQQEVSQRTSRQPHLHVPSTIMMPQQFHASIRCCPAAAASMNVPPFELLTPADRFLARARNIEAKEPPSNFIQQCKYDRLSQDIWKQFTTAQQTQNTFVIKMRLWRFLYLVIKQTYPRYGLYLVGSTMTGLGTNSSDIDLCLVSKSLHNGDQRSEALYVLEVLNECLQNCVRCNYCASGEFYSFQLIEARVPILRFKDAIHNIEVDLNFNNSVGIKNTHLLRLYSQLDWRTRPLVLVVKLWAQYHDINDAKKSTISSYSLVLMVIHFLQYGCHPYVLPCLHTLHPNKFHSHPNEYSHLDLNEVIDPYETKNQQPLGKLFVEFLKYYSCFDFRNNAISVRTGGLLSVNECRVAKSHKNDIHQWKELNIEEPFDLSNTARSVYDPETFKRVKEVFNASWHLLEDTLDLSSIFSPILTLPSVRIITQE